VSFLGHVGLSPFSSPKDLFFLALDSISPPMPKRRAFFLFLVNVYRHISLHKGRLNSGVRAAVFLFFFLLKRW